jgi:hypothetical protein
MINHQNANLHALYSSKQGHQTEAKFTSIEVSRMKRDAEYQSWLIHNFSAVRIQKVFRGSYTKDYLLKILEEKYCDDLLKPALILQSIYRSVREAQIAK